MHFLFLSFSFICQFRPRNSANRCSNPLFVGRGASSPDARPRRAIFSLPPLLPSRRVRFSFSSPSCSLSSSHAPFAPSEVARRRRDRGCESRKSRLEESPRCRNRGNICAGLPSPRSRMRGGKAGRDEGG